MSITGVCRNRIATILVVASSLAVLVAVSSAPAAGAAGQAAKGDAFYVPPKPLKKAKPGTIIRTTPIDAPAGAHAWKVLYHSRAVDGSDIAVSGVVIAPTGKAPRGGRVVVSWAHGAAGPADRCAPSKQPDIASGAAFTFNSDGFVSAIPMLQTFLDAGYAVAATDYEGLGTPGVHPFLVGESEGRGVLDAARAARALKTSGVKNKVLVFGHSQGGNAALFTGELAASYAPELHVLGVAAEAPISTDTELFFRTVGSVSAANNLIATRVEAFHAAYPEFDPAEVLTPDAITQAALVDEKCGLPGPSSSPDLALAQNPLDVPALQAILHANSAGNRPTGAPLLVVQAAVDDGAPQVLTDLYVAKACAAGDTVDYHVYPGTDHLGVVLAAADDVAVWFADRVSGAAVPDTCT